MGRPKGLPKTGGRKKGVRNKRTRANLTEAEAAGLMPLQYMLQVLRDEKQPDARRDWAAEKSAPYLHARLNATTHEIKESVKLQIVEEIVDDCSQNNSPPPAAS